MTEFDQYRDGYSAQIDDAIAFSGQPQDFFTRAKARYLLDTFSKVRSQNGTSSKPLDVLDIGCGHGLIHPHLRPAQPGIKLTGIDVAGTVIEEARADNPDVHYDVYEGTRLPYDARTFDIAFAIAVMHHVPPDDWKSFLVEAARVVRPGGLVIIIEHNPLNPLTKKIVRSCPFDQNAVLLRSNRLAKLFRAAGMVDIERQFIIFTPFDTPFFHKLDASLGWLPLGAQYCMAAHVPS
ncbi:SAM-dependent methyltransferase [Bradyrhizobium japonicum USDA 38]|jgi:SAM-dependent methyltransferase|uniref:class I SAM-dependent methyltransferase n=1 Tax=Bradyrhizobium TaxID=374 RepID=UPI00048548D5|nr:class I SAM-dependent methyltransferase [Bradyrhizobium japonicum]MBR0759517.1 class I SAM-dependent methyltransferase [Bradyrhizobium japonicum]MCS3495014.1 SAM-dependent methyltransferase [Bradyrhizobium japonicum]MCS3894583.1 SAM-dependent methyltransferase [Bradyrhizobium japonicum USDA 38]MCS3947097.1 SAM-dependent methyltransferase [Bradyrhizobium japonicum]MCS3962823.1 SAM-dependent methyltransferase [Bradyrhizobium japonicum]